MLVVNGKRDGWRLFKVLDRPTPFFTLQMPKTAPYTLAKTHPHIAKYVMSSAFRKVVTRKERRYIAFRCLQCRKPFRERVHELVRQGRAACDSCFASQGSCVEEMVVEHTEAVMTRLQRQGVVRCFQVTRNQKLTKAEVASVVVPRRGDDGSVSASLLLRWNVTVTAKVGTADDGSAGIQTQLLHIEVVDDNNNAMMTMMIKDAVVKAAVASAYGARFKKVGLLRVVKPDASPPPRRRHHQAMLSEVEAFVMREFAATAAAAAPAVGG